MPGARIVCPNCGYGGNRLEDWPELAGDRLMVDKASFQLRSPRRWEVVAFRDPQRPSHVVVKRVIGLPGEKVEIRDRQVFVNGVPLNEPYIQYPASRSYAATVVPADSLFVMGDNRDNSSDSRAWGPLPIHGGIVGRAVLRYWPPERIGILPAYSY